MSTECSFDLVSKRRTFTIVSDQKKPPRDGLCLSVISRVTWGGKTQTSNTFISVSVDDLIGLRAAIDSIIELEQGE